MALGNKKLLGLALTTALTSVSLQSHAQQAFTGGSIISTDGDFVISTPDANTTIGNQTGQLTTFGTPNSSIAANETVKILQDTTSSTLVVYAQNGSDPTRILGNLFTRLKDGSGNETAARGGNIFIKDGDGIFTGTDSVIDANSVILTTGDISFNSDNKVEIDNFGTGSRVILNGAITVAEGGLAAFVAPTVVNSGVITAKAGRIELAGANTKTTVDLYGDGLVEIAVDDTNTENLLARNNGELLAKGGVIHMTTGAAENLVNSTVNLNGIARADSATQVGGKIILGGKNTGRVRIASKAQARGETGGGSIEVEAENVNMTTDAVLNVRAFTNGNGGTINLLARNNAILNNRIRAMGGSNGGNGGTITTSAVNVLSFGNGNLEVNAGADNGDAGQWIIDPVNLNINAATAGIWNAALGTGTSINASATNNVILNSDITWASGADFALTAGNILRLNNAINGNGNVTLTGTNLVDVNAGVTASMIDVNGAAANLNADLNAGTITGDVATVNVESNAAEIQDGVDIAALNGRVNVGSGTFVENVNITKAVEIRGSVSNDTIIDASGGLDGFNISTDLGNNNVILRHMTVKDAQRDGVRVEDTAALRTIVVTDMNFINNGLRGVSVFGDSALRSRIMRSTFLNNGMNSTSKGDGDILFYLHNGDILIEDVNIQGNTGGLADYGVQIIGSATKAESGNIELNRVSVAGQYRVANLGIQQYDGIKSLNMNDVGLGGQTDAGNNSVSTAGWGGALFLSNLGEDDLDLGNTEFKANDSNYIVLGAFNGNTEFTSTNIDATKATFLGKLGSDMSLAENFAVENKVGHKMDFSPFGLVTWNAGNLYATQQSENGFAGVIQRGVDASDVNGNIWVQDGTFAGGVNVNKSVNLYGAQAGVDARGRTGVPETIVVPNSPGMTVTADNVVVDGFTVENGTNGIVVDGANNVQVMNNIVKNNTDTTAGRRASNWKTGVGIIVKDGSSNVTVKQNLADSNTDGIRVIESGANIVVEKNDVSNSTDKGVIIKQTNSVKVLDNNLDGNRQGVRVNIADNTEVRDNIIDNSTDEAIHIDRGSDKNQVVDNQIDRAKYGVRIQGGMDNVVDDNDIENFTNVGVHVLDGAINTDVTDNFIRNALNSTGVLVENSTGTTVGGIGNTLRNRIFDVLNGVEVNGGSNTKVIGNDIRRVDFGVLANTAGSLNVYRNMIDDSFTGVDISFSHGAKIVDNVIKNASIGVFVEEGKGVLIDDNDITNFDDAGVVIERTVNADVIDNFIQSTRKGTIGIDVIDGIGAQIGGDGNTLRNRIYDVDTGVQLSGDTWTTIDGNDFRRNHTGILATDTFDGGTRYISQNLTITDNTFDQGYRAIDLDSARNVLVGGYRDGNTINNFNTGVKVVGGNNVNIDDNIIRNVDYGIYADYVGQLNIEDNNIDGRYRRSGKGTTGIYVGNSYNAQIGGQYDGNYVEDFGTGIRVSNSRSADVEYNRVEETSENAIYVSDSAYADVDNNDVRDAGTNGIKVSNSFDADIRWNDVRRTGDDGIDVERSRIADIRNNYIEDAGDDGIDVENTGTYFGYGVDINDNVINGAKEDGINVYKVAAVDIIDNDIYKAGRDGINVSWSNYADIKDNDILGTNGRFFRNGKDGAGRDGIHVEDSAHVDIEGNEILAGRNGFFSLGGKGAGRFGIYSDDTYNVDVKDNKVLGTPFGDQGSGDDAIRVEDSAYADIERNKVFNVGGDAVHVKRSFAVDVIGNEASFTGDDGIDIEHSRYADVEGNTISFTRNNGIEVEWSDYADINKVNRVTRSGLNGVYVEGGEGVDVEDNIIRSARNNGIEVNNTVGAFINENDVRNSRAAGVLVNGAFGTEVDTNTLIGNDVGVEVRGFVEDDFIDSPIGDEQTLQAAFRVRAPYGSPSDETLILNNIIEDSNTAGVRTSGNGVGSVEITGNQLDNNTIGFLLEGGEIDISNLLNPNTINGGETGMRFIGENVSLTNNTLGATIFRNQVNGENPGNFVELVDGALFNPGTPTIIDGLAVSWDGLIPLNSPLGAGIITAAQRQAIENRIIDFDDDNTLGQILVGLGFDLSQEDVFALNLFSLSPDATNVDVTFNGLPRTSAASLTELANLEPNAGGDDPEDLADIEPAAGGSEGCWASVAETEFDGTVSFTFGADPISEETCSN